MSFVLDCCYPNGKLKFPYTQDENSDHLHLLLFQQKLLGNPTNIIKCTKYVQVSVVVMGLWFMGVIEKDRHTILFSYICIIRRVIWFICPWYLN